jgi:hypothetical protein
MKNRHVAQLDRQMRLQGEPMTLRLQNSAEPEYNFPIRGIVKTLSIARLIGGITATNYLVIISPDDLGKAGYQANASTISPPADRRVPPKATWLVFRGRVASIQAVDAVYDGSECVRIEAKVTG